MLPPTPPFSSSDSEVAGGRGRLMNRKPHQSNRMPSSTRDDPNNRILSPPLNSNRPTYGNGEYHSEDDDRYPRHQQNNMPLKGGKYSGNTRNVRDEQEVPVPIPSKGVLKGWGSRR